MDAVFVHDQMRNGNGPGLNLNDYMRQGGGEVEIWRIDAPRLLALFNHERPLTRYAPLLKLDRPGFQAEQLVLYHEKPQWLWNNKGCEAVPRSNIQTLS